MSKLEIEMGPDDRQRIISESESMTLDEAVAFALPGE